MAFNNKFNFVGEIFIPKAESKMKFFEESKSKDGKWNLTKMKFGMNVDKSNGQFAEIFSCSTVDSKGKISSFSKNEGDKKGSKLEIPWKDRNDQKIINMVADFKLLKVNLGEEKVFLHEYDMVQYLKEEFPKHAGKKIYIGGDFKVESGGGKTYQKFNPKFIKLANEDEKPRFQCTVDVFFNADSMTEDRFEEDKLIDVAGYVSQYIDKDTGSKFMPMNFVINASKVDVNNPDHVKRLNYLKNIFKISGDSFCHIPWEINAFRGAEEVEFTEDMLTDSQREQVELGISKIEDFKPKTKPVGGNKIEFRLSKPLIEGAFTDGAVDSGLSEEEFRAQIYTTSETKTVTQVKEETGVQLFEMDDDDEDLF